MRVTQRHGLQIDRDAARAFFRVAIRADTGEGRHQRRLAVIHVTGEPDDHRTGAPPLYQYSSAGMGESLRCSRTQRTKSRRWAAVACSPGSES